MGIFTKGREEVTTAAFEINGVTPTLVYALPSSDKLYLDHRERWFVECYVSSKCLVAMEVRDSAGQAVFTKEATIPESAIIRWAGLKNDMKRAAPGRYTVRMWSKLNPEYAAEFSLDIEEKCPTSREVAPTGPIIPERVKCFPRKKCAP